MDRSKARECAMKLMYENELGGDGGEDTCTGLLELVPGESEYDFMTALANGAIARTDEIDRLIEKYANGWKTERMSKVDLAILRIAVYELLEKCVPAAVAINEAVRIAKSYSTDKAAPFINGVLGSIAREIAGE